MSEFRNCIDCGCNHAIVITSTEDCSCECHHGDLEESK